MINQEIIIDFDLPKTLQNTIIEAEELAKENNVEYYCVADTIDVLCKEAFVNGLITREQWDLITSRYMMC